MYRLTLKDVPVDGFWSVSVYNDKGYFQKNALGDYSLNNLTAKPDATGAVVIQFGGCEKAKTDCLPIVKGWNYTVRLYRPRKEILDRSRNCQKQSSPCDHGDVLAYLDIAAVARRRLMSERGGHPTRFMSARPKFCNGNSSHPCPQSREMSA